MRKVRTRQDRAQEHEAYGASVCRVIDANESKVTDDGGGSKRAPATDPSGNCELIEEHKKALGLVKEFLSLRH